MIKKNTSQLYELQDISDKLSEFYPPKPQKFEKTQRCFQLQQPPVSEDTENENTCHLCLKSFCSKYTLSTHIRTIHRQDPYRCHKCPKSYKAKIDLKWHYQNSHKGKMPEFLDIQPQKKLRNQNNLLELEQLNSESIQNNQYQQDLQKQNKKCQKNESFAKKKKVSGINYNQNTNTNSIYQDSNIEVESLLDWDELEQCSFNLEIVEQKTKKIDKNFGENIKEILQNDLNMPCVQQNQPLKSLITRLDSCQNNINQNIQNIKSVEYPLNQLEKQCYNLSSIDKQQQINNDNYLIKKNDNYINLPQNSSTQKSEITALESIQNHEQILEKKQSNLIFSQAQGIENIIN
ncbi:hypothetical protein PPERSA_06712 [Pseudocohnilembus persalinus]|uniref:C2H2-type domain-containing protein n=1 Tax=Pseudocohnilembus persalinus TaxID=266149 RepID=A0A0V0QS43_PSEPJ|nr:hypothetical protein PPERSA_06712 [Pseudocohnilembus persalinus]|eukprot:KRX05078.1 hypothetical protein PPERSA_06712 [Pseudocohnilembus persalinus]